jgi:hypothetical protein
VTVREHIKQIQAEVGQTDLQPDRAAELLTRLSALYGNCLDHIREVEQLYRVVLRTELEQKGAAARAKIRAECSPEYQRLREAKDAAELVQELTRSLKYFLRQKEVEWREMSR